MLLVSAKSGPFKSIDEPQTVEINEGVIVFVGMNEAGKTVFLQSLEKSNDALGVANFNHVEDYPRKDLPSYLKQHKAEPAVATVLTYELTEEEVTAANDELHTNIPFHFQFSVSHKYDNSSTLSFSVDERPVLVSMLKECDVSSDVRAAVKKVASLRQIPESLQDISLTPEDEAFVKTIGQRISKTQWPSVVQWEVWQWLKRRIPKFVYFGAYNLLPSKSNLADLALRVEQAKTDPKRLSNEHRGVLALLRMADISISDFTKPGGYEPLKAKIEGVSISLTDQIMEFWKQNEDLEVEVDIKPDPDDEPPLNNGPNLYLRIKNRRHRGVSNPFRQRSQGLSGSSVFSFGSIAFSINLNRKGKVKNPL